MKHRLSVALIHWPVLDRQGRVVATNVTNFDIHDIARAGRVYGIEQYFIVHRMVEQLMFVERILDHWKVGYGAKFNPMRKTALGMVKTAQTLEKALEAWGEEKPLVVATAARDIEHPPRITFRGLREKIQGAPSRPVLLVFGTGFGLTQELLSSCDLLLEPVKGASEDDYRHLSVRSAVSIILDRLLGTW